MTAYRRYRVPGGCYFFTVNLLNRQDGLLVERIAILREVVQRVRSARPFHVDAWVILPDHMHMVWTLPDGDADFSTRIRLIKHGFSRRLDGWECLSDSRTKRRERGIWQRRFWEHVVRNERDYAAHIDYVHFNPVKHGLVAAPGDWPHSTFARRVKKGMYPATWAGDPAQDLEAGERFVSKT